MSSCWSELLTVLDRTLVVWHTLPYSTLPYSTLLTIDLTDRVTVGGATWEDGGDLRGCCVDGVYTLFMLCHSL